MATATNARIATLPVLSRHASFWAVAFAFLSVSAFSTAPSGLYGLYAQRDHFSSLTVTIVYAVYVVGVVASLIVFGHVSDWYGRRPVLIPSLLLALVAAAVFLSSTSLTGLVVARVLTGIALGASIATATAYLSDLDAGPDGVPTRRSGVVATASNIGGLALGPLLAGVLASYARSPLTLPYLILGAAMAAGLVCVVLSVEGHAPLKPRPAYHVQRLQVPKQARPQFMAAATGAFATFAVFGLFAGLAGTLLRDPLNHPSAALAGLAVFLNFGCGAVVQASTSTWSTHRLVATGIGPIILGLSILTGSVWMSPPSLALFLVAGAVAGAGCGAVFRGSLGTVLATSGPDGRAGALATLFTVGYLGISVPVVGAGVVLQFLSPRVTLLVFAAGVVLGILAASPRLLGLGQR